MPAVGRLVLAAALLAATGCRLGNLGGRAATSATPTRATRTPWAAEARAQLLSL